jgi:phosphoglycerate dehydrogenase-like enzyme
MTRSAPLPGRPDDAPVVTLMTTLSLTDEVRARLDEAAPGVELHEVGYREDHGLRNARALGTVTDADRATAQQLSDEEWAILERSTAVVVLDVPDGLLERVMGLRWVQTMSAGTDHLDVEGMAERGIVLTTGAGIAAVPIAEFALGRILQFTKRFRELDERQARGVWEPVFGRRLAGQTLGIVGLGAIGRAVARRARAFEMRVLANRRRAAPGDVDPDVDELFTVDGLDDMLARCDVVVIAAAATEETTRLFDARRLAAMKPGAVLCNVARGAIVDEPALVDALRSGHLAAALLDTTAEEPTPPDSPLWSAPNCYLSPHTATGGTPYADNLLDLVARNLAHFVRGEPLENVVGRG